MTSIACPDLEHSVSGRNYALKSAMWACSRTSVALEFSGWPAVQFPVGVADLLMRVVLRSLFLPAYAPWGWVARFFNHNRTLKSYV